MTCVLPRIPAGSVLCAQHRCCLPWACCMAGTWALQRLSSSIAATLTRLAPAGGCALAGAVTSAEPAVSRGQWPASLSPQGSFEGRHTPCGPADSALSAGLEASSQPYLVCTTTTPPPVMLGEDIRCRGAHEGTLPALGAQLDAEGPDGLFEDPFQVNGAQPGMCGVLLRWLYSLQLAALHSFCFLEQCRSYRYA